MVIDGKVIAQVIKDNLKVTIQGLSSKNIVPHLAVILIGDDPASVTYVKQKGKVAVELGVKLTTYNPSADGQPAATKNELITLVNKLNFDPSVHGIIIQRPTPIDITKEELDSLVIPAKDVDGFHPQSLFKPPVANAVLKILGWVFKQEIVSGRWSLVAGQNQKVTNDQLLKTNDNFFSWLGGKKILVIGRGETAGKPIANTLNILECKVAVAHSKTVGLKELCMQSDIVISCVGRPNIVRHDMVSDKTILIGVGLHTESGKLAADYNNQEEIAQLVAYFTPVPGGVGPVNVACLFENLLEAVQNTSVQNISA